MRIEITEQLFSEILEYLGKRPYIEVAMLISKIAQSKNQKITEPATVEKGKK